MRLHLTWSVTSLHSQGYPTSLRSRQERDDVACSRVVVPEQAYHRDDDEHEHHERVQPALGGTVVLVVHVALGLERPVIEVSEALADDRRCQWQANPRRDAVLSRSLVRAALQQVPLERCSNG